MPKTKRRTREEWVEAAAIALVEYGIDGIRVERLARDLGVTKGSFYWHFADRRALLQALLDSWAEQGTAAIIQTVEDEGGDAHQRLRRLWEVASNDGEQAFELALRDWARRDEVARHAVRQTDRRRMAYLRTLVGEIVIDPETVEARCLLLYSLLIGDWFLDIRHPHKTRKRVLKEALRFLTS
ncbi:MAG: TetR/AcrR family transcriptional regulator [Myxococcota bacterium]